MPSVTAVEAKGDNPTPFAAHMDATDQPEVGAAAPKAGAEAEDADEAANVVSLASRLGLKGYAKRT